VVRRLTAAVEPSDVVLGGGNVKKLKKLPPGCRAVDNRKAFVGGFRLWEPSRPAAKPVPRKRARPTAKPPRRKYSKLRPATKPNRPRSPVAVGRSVPTPPPIARSGAVGTPRLTSPTQATSKARHPAKTGPTPPVAEGPATAGSVPKYAEVTKHFAPSVLRTPRRARQLKVEPPAPNPPSPGIESAPAQKNPNEPTPT